MTPHTRAMIATIVVTAVTLLTAHARADAPGAQLASGPGIVGH